MGQAAHGRSRSSGQNAARVSLSLPIMGGFGTAIAHLRNVLGNETYESLARNGETMTTAAIASYAYDQIDQARTTLNAVSK